MPIAPKWFKLQTSNLLIVTDIRNLNRFGAIGI